MTSTVVLRTWPELRRLAASHPFGADTSKSAVTFLAEKPTAAAVRRLRELDVAPDEAKVVGRDVLIHYPNGIQGSRLTGALLETHARRPGHEPQLADGGAPRRADRRGG